MATRNLIQQPSRLRIQVLSQKRKLVVLMLFELDLGISGLGPTKRIPYYNILWADVSNDTLTIDYVSDPAKSNVKTQKMSFIIDAPDKAASAEQFATEVRFMAYKEAKPRKRAYVLVNPNSGPGGAVKKWLTEVRPLFEAARMDIHVVMLTRGGEATDLVESMDIDEYDTVVACSGDGTPHEIFNGLAKRPDARKALSKIAVSHIPCGSGNAMAINLYGSNKPGAAAVGIIKGVVTPLDLVSITQGSKRYVSFLSQALGIIAESDLGTEHLRWMGPRRFEVGLMMRVYQKKCYPCDLAIKVEVLDKNGVKAHYRRGVKKLPLPVSTNGQTHEGGGLPELKYGTVNDDIFGMDGWELVSYDQIGNFYCGNMAYMSPDANFFPSALPSDGCMDLVIINGDIPTIKATKTLLAVESGKFFDMPHVSYKKISAYRILPRNQKDGFISIDGERVPFQPFQAEIHQGLGRVLSKNGRFEANGPLGWDNEDDDEDPEGNAEVDEDGLRSGRTPDTER